VPAVAAGPAHRASTRWHRRDREWTGCEWMDSWQVRVGKQSVQDRPREDHCRIQCPAGASSTADRSRPADELGASMAKKYGLEEGKKLKKPVFELSYKNDELNDPLINNDHAVALEIVTEEELENIRTQALKINELLQKLYLDANLVLVDFKIEFGKTKDGEIILADEISPDTCRLWDKDTNEKLDKDRFRRDLGSVMEAYEEVLRRLENA